jgi:drug/metabolite transporter (DMT)-like permease
MTSKATNVSQPAHSMMGILLIMIGAFSFSIMFLMVKFMASANTFTLVFYRSLVQIILSLGTLWQKGVNPLGPPEVRGPLVARAVFGGVAVIAWFFGIQILPLPDAVTLQFTTPPFAAAFAVVMVGEVWKPLDMIGAVVCLSGVALIAHPTWLFGAEAADTTAVVDSDDGPSAFMKALAVLITTGGAASAGIAYVTVRVIGDRADAIVMVLYYAVLSLPLCVFGSGWLEGTWQVWNLEGFTVTDYLLLLLMGFGGYGGQWCTNLGLQRETAATATLATSTQIVWTYVFELLFLHEALNAWSLGGTTLILGYMLVVGFIKMTQSNHGGPSEEETALLPEDLERQDYQATNGKNGH